MVASMQMRPCLISTERPLERKLIPIFGKSSRIPETNGCLNAQLILKSPQWRIGVVCPVTPSQACQAILEEHTDDRHHGKSAICYLSCEFLVFRLWVNTRENLPAKVTWSLRAVVHARDFAVGTISDNPSPAC